MKVVANGTFGREELLSRRRLASAGPNSDQHPVDLFFHVFGRRSLEVAPVLGDNRADSLALEQQQLAYRGSRARSAE